MKKIVKVGDKEIKLTASAKTTYLYRDVFLDDIFKTFNDALQDIKDINNITATEIPVEVYSTLDRYIFVMNVAADDTQPMDFLEWLDQFEAFDLYQLYPTAVEMWKLTNVSLSKSKKNTEKQPEK